MISAKEAQEYNESHGLEMFVTVSIQEMVWLVALKSPVSTHVGEGHCIGAAYIAAKREYELTLC